MGDLPIPDGEILWRRVTSDDKIQTEDGFRVKSSVFKSSQSDGISVHRAALTSLEVIRQRYPEAGVVAVLAGNVRNAGPYDIIPDPIKDDPLLPDDPSHALIIPAPNAGGATRE